MMSDTVLSYPVKKNKGTSAPSAQALAYAYVPVLR
jgi:hypothetical protein